MGRLKWDAQVRMKQAKLRATGGNKTREEVVQAIIEENVKAAQQGVEERFEEIAEERGFHDNRDIGERRGQVEARESYSIRSSHTQHLRMPAIIALVVTRPFFTTWYSVLSPSRQATRGCPRYHVAGV